MDELRWLTIPFRADRPPERARLAAEAEEAWARARGALDGLPPRLARLPALLLDGDWAEARRVATAARTTGIFRNMARTVLGPLARAQGEHDLAWAVVHEDLPAGPESVPGDTYFPTALILLRLAAALALDAGDLPPARCLAGWRMTAGSVRAVRSTGRAEGVLGWAAYHRAAGDAARAYECAAAALDARRPTAPAARAARRAPSLGLTGHGRRSHIGGGRASRSGARVGGALRRALRARANPRRARRDAGGARGGGGAAGRAGDRPHARCAAAALADTSPPRRPLSGAQSLCGRRTLPTSPRNGSSRNSAAYLADPDARRRFLDASTAAIPPVYRARGRKTPLGGLTAREQEVVAQIAQGKSNREIAEALFIAEKTVEMHVSNSLSKLGFRSRAQLAAWAVARDGERPTAHPDEP